MSLQADEWFAGKKLMICTPSYDGFVHADYTTALLQSIMDLAKVGVQTTLFYAKDSSLITRSRNICAAHFMASSCDMMLFIDADMSWEPSAIKRLISHDLPLVGGAYPRRDGRAFALNKWHGKLSDPYVPCDMIGTGFMMMKREVLQALIDGGEAQKIWDDAAGAAVNEHIHRWFYIGLHTGDRDLGEDYTFCRNYERVGGKVYIDPHVTLSHHVRLKLTECMFKRWSEAGMPIETEEPLAGIIVSGS